MHASQQSEALKMVEPLQVDRLIKTGIPAMRITRPLHNLQDGMDAPGSCHVCNNDNEIWNNDWKNNTYVR